MSELKNALGIPSPWGPSTDASTSLLRGKAPRAAEPLIPSLGNAHLLPSRHSARKGTSCRPQAFSVPTTLKIQSPQRPSVEQVPAPICESTRRGTWQPSSTVWRAAWIRSLKKAFPEEQRQEMLPESPRKVVSGSAARGKNLRWMKSKVAWRGHFFSP